MKICKLQPSKHKGRWLVCLEDGETLRIGEGDVTSFGLYEGMALEDSDVPALRAAERRAAAREKALNWIAIRPLSRKELIRRLTARPRDGTLPAADENLAEETAAWLEDLGFLNDAEYACMVVRRCESRGYGVRRMQEELFRRGVPREEWAQALEQAQDPGSRIDTFLAKRLSGRTPSEKELKRLSSALARRGYRWDEIRAGLRRWEESDGYSQPDDPLSITE